MSEMTGAPSTGSSAPSTSTGSVNTGGTSSANAGSNNHTNSPPTNNNRPNAGQASSTPGHGEAPTSSTPSSETFDVKVNGKMVKMSREQAIAYASMGLASQSRFDEASKIRKEHEQFKQGVNKDPIRALMDAGLTRDQARDHFEKWYTTEFIEPETLTPDQRRLKEYERKVQQYEQQQKELEQKTQQEQEETLTNHQREYLQKQIIDAMDQSGLPKTKWFVQRMAFYMKQNLNNGWEAPMDVIVTQVKNDRQSIMSDITEQADVPTLINLFGEGIIKKINQHYLNQLRQSRQQPAVDQNASPNNRGRNGSGVGVQNPGGTGKVSYEEVRDRLRDMRTGKFR